MGYYPGKMKPEQPGAHGVRYATKTNELYCAATAKKLLMRVKVDPHTLHPIGAPELVVAGRMWDDFCIDEDSQVLYVTTASPKYDRCRRDGCRAQQWLYSECCRNSFTKKLIDLRALHKEEGQGTTAALPISQWMGAPLRGGVHCSHKFKVFAPLQHAASRLSSRSGRGKNATTIGFPKRRLNSRLNWEGLAYPTRTEA